MRISLSGSPLNVQIKLPAERGRPSADDGCRLDASTRGVTSPWGYLKISRQIDELHRCARPAAEIWSIDRQRGLTEVQRGAR